MRSGHIERRRCSKELGTLHQDRIRNPTVKTLADFTNFRNSPLLFEGPLHVVKVQSCQKVTKTNQEEGEEREDETPARREASEGGEALPIALTRRRTVREEGRKKGPQEG